jgi:hypothetical protein
MIVVSLYFMLLMCVDVLGAGWRDAVAASWRAGRTLQELRNSLHHFTCRRWEGAVEGCRAKIRAWGWMQGIRVYGIVIVLQVVVCGTGGCFGRRCQGGFEV